MAGYIRRPEWLKVDSLNLTVLERMRKLTGSLKLHTVCESARCPNRSKCFEKDTATFMILGDACTRNCTFCAVKKGKPQPPDPGEPYHVVEAIKQLRLRYVVITSVTRDDLPDGGSGHFARTTNAIHEYDPGIMVEVLVPDFRGSIAALQTVIDARPYVFNHNVETVSRLYPQVRPQAQYQRSLELLRRAKLLNSTLLTKSGLMVGLGESPKEVIEVMEDLREAGCDILTIGQYLPPSLSHHQVVRYVPLEEFRKYEDIGNQMGFLATSAAPLVRSSFHAAETYISATQRLTA